MKKQRESARQGHCLSPWLLSMVKNCSKIIKSEHQFLSCLVLSCLVLSYVLSCFVLRLVFSCLALSCLISSLVLVLGWYLSCLGACLVLPCLVLSLFPTYPCAQPQGAWAPMFLSQWWFIPCAFEDHDGVLSCLVLPCLVSKLHWTVQGSGSTHDHIRLQVRKGETQVEDGDYERRRETSSSFVFLHSNPCIVIGYK